MYLGPLPQWVLPLVQRLCSEGIFSTPPDQLIVNEYEPGQGIASHIDCVSCFGRVIASVSLGSTCIMELVRDEASLALLLHPGSLLILADEARFHWQHGIRARRGDLYAGVRWPRSRRISLTFRTVRVA